LINEQQFPKIKDGGCAPVTPISGSFRIAITLQQKQLQSIYQLKDIKSLDHPKGLA
jgi:hypothetical protein